MTGLNDFKKQMRRFFDTTVDKENGETFTSWFAALMDALKEDGQVHTINGKTWIEDEE